MSSLINTDLIIDALHDHSSAFALLDRLAPSGIAISILTLGELYEGVYRSPDPVAAAVPLTDVHAGSLHESHVIPPRFA